MQTTGTTSAHNRCESHSESQTEGALLTFDLWCRSAPCCSTRSLIRSRWPCDADTRTAVQPSCEHEIDTYTISPCLYVTYYPFQGTSVSVDQTPQWFLLHCSTEIFRTSHFRCCWWPLENAHSHSPLHPVNSQTHLRASVLAQHGHSELRVTGRCSPTMQGRVEIFVLYHMHVRVYIYMCGCVCHVLLQVYSACWSRGRGQLACHSLGSGCLNEGSSTLVWGRIEWVDVSGLMGSVHTRVTVICSPSGLWSSVVRS